MKLQVHTLLFLVIISSDIHYKACVSKQCSFYLVAEISNYVLTTTLICINFNFVLACVFYLPFSSSFVNNIIKDHNEKGAVNNTDVVDP